MLRSVRDIARAFDEGRWHTQRFTKNAGAIGDNQWQDWSYASGQPAYDARIGNALQRTAVVATRNDAIWFPPIAGDQERRLSELRVYVTPAGSGQFSCDFLMYDLVAVYPLIDGDNTDLQTMDNTVAYPRYADGLGLRAILVNHIAPGVALADATIGYTDSDNNARTMTVSATLYGTGKAAWTLGTAGTAGPLYLPTEGRGIKQIDSVTFPAAPGGLWAIYICRPLPSLGIRTGGGATAMTVYTEKSLAVEAGWNLPRIYDGAHLGFFYLPNGGLRTVAIVGSAQFIWG